MDKAFETAFLKEEVMTHQLITDDFGETIKKMEAYSGKKITNPLSLYYVFDTASYIYKDQQFVANHFYKSSRLSSYDEETIYEMMNGATNYLLRELNEDGQDIMR